MAPDLPRALALRQSRLAAAESEFDAAWSALQAEPWPQRGAPGEMPLRPGHGRYQQAYERRDQLLTEIHVLEWALKLATGAADE